MGLLQWLGCQNDRIERAKNFWPKFITQPHHGSSRVSLGIIKCCFIEIYLIKVPQEKNPIMQICIYFIIKFSSRVSLATFLYTLFSDRNKKMGADRARVHLESSNLVYRHIFSCWEERHGFFGSPICSSISLIDKNTKMGVDRARINLESSNLVCRHIFWHP